jgi:glycosyltransferase involved in cell wall biosynthesis
MKPRVLLDIAFLGLAHERKSAARGVERMVLRLFEDLPATGCCDLSFVATSHLAATHDFLASRGINPEEKLKFTPGQLAPSRQGRLLVRQVHDLMEVPGWRARLKRKSLSVRAGRLTRGEADVPAGCLAGADIYHTPHTPQPLLPFPATVQADRRLKKFVSIHDFMLYLYPGYFGRAHQPYFERVRQSLTETTFAFCTTEWVRADILRLTAIRPERIFLAPPAADRRLFYPVGDPAVLAAVRNDLGLPETPYFLALSAPDPHKNFGHLIHCLAELAQAGELPDHNLVIVGRNNARHPLVREALARHPGLARRILTPGFVPDEQLAALYSGATAFLFPSLAEGFGLPPLEAMQCGVPVIASNTTSMPEVIGDAGLLLPPTDVDAWCQAMLKVAGDAGLRAALARKSIERAALFSWERYITATIHGYRTSMECEDK